MMIDAGFQFNAGCLCVRVHKLRQICVELNNLASNFTCKGGED